MIHAFMEGIHSAKKGKKVLDNPYICGLQADPYNATLWNSGYLHQLEIDENVAFQREATSYSSSRQVSDAS